ncbi:PepSY domain-containing protein [Xylophilus rhododendri]|uniref:PepSY domain-containing protein n=1 Tax=Xylophilus rhododendri TaxID=2697032 RepID=UPI001E2E4D8B|nr:PepSY domain-containing protein [Xylophilus rhododendri]
MKRLLIAPALVLASAAALAQHGNIQCSPEAHKSEWRGQMELQKTLEERGWKVRQVKTYNSCYEVYGFDEKGARVEVFFHPKTFEKVAEVPQDK